MNFLIDTDICSAYLRGDGRVFNRFIQHSGGMCISAVAYGELLTWAKRKAAPPSRLAAPAPSANPPIRLQKRIGGWLVE